MSINDKGLKPQDITDYIVSKNILDKKTMYKALQDYANAKIDDDELTFSQYLVDKKLMLQGTIEKVINELTASKKVEKVYNTKELLDEDVSTLQTEIEKNLTGQEAKLDELLEPTQEEINKFLSENGIDWQGRRMSPEDKETLIKKMASLKSNSEVSKTNGVFVLSWMENLLQS